MEKGREGGNPLRGEIDRLIDDGDLRGLLYKAAELHGHLCSYLTYGVMAGYIAVRQLEVKNTGMEEVIAIVETNNCFSDGVQMVTGCSFGNNALIYRDLGKTAVTVAKRDGSSIRIALDPDFEDSRNVEYPEANALWDKIVAKREKATTGEHGRLMRLFAEMSIKELSNPPGEMFRTKLGKVKVPGYAPIFSSVRCSVCGENVVENRARVRDGESVCIDCYGGERYVLDGRGISAEV